VDASALADQLVVLDSGRVAQTGTPGDITARPRSRWVAELTGTNLFEGVATSDGHIVLEGGSTLLSADHLEPGPVLAVVHPRAVSLSRERPVGSARNNWSGRVSAVEPIGDRVRVRVDAEPDVVAEVTPAAVQDIGVAESAEVWVAVKATEIEVYPA
jgi:molybdate transport system ATP-binding protein